jgi:hypothetical protein
MNKNIKILVCTHKKHHIEHNDLYVPVHAGKALVNFDLGFQGDNTGDNISEKNSYYCELTVQYWAWKNIKNLDYIGFCHYRRFFNFSSITADNTIDFDRVFRKYDIILTPPDHAPYSNMLHLRECTTREDVYILIHIISTYYPAYKQVMLDYLCNSNLWTGYNMFITSKKCFDEYSKWLFDVLLSVEKSIKISPYNRLKRVLGYFGEVLLPIYCIHNHLKIKYLPLCEHPDTNSWKSFIYGKLYKIRDKICFKLMQPFKLKSINFPESTIVGLDDIITHVTQIPEIPKGETPLP